jgi:hypothetical protein
MWLRDLRSLLPLSIVLHYGMVIHPQHGKHPAKPKLVFASD